MALHPGVAAAKGSLSIQIQQRLAAERLSLDRRSAMDGSSSNHRRLTTLPVYDEVIGLNGLSDAGFNDYLTARLRPGASMC